MQEDTYLDDSGGEGSEDYNGGKKAEVDRREVTTRGQTAGFIAVTSNMIDHPTYRTLYCVAKNSTGTRAFMHVF